MNKKTKYAIGGALIVGTLAGAKNAITQLDKMQENDKFDWWQLIGHILGWGGVGGIAGLGIGAIADYKNSQVSPLDTDSILANLAATSVLSKSDPEYISLDKKVQVLIGLLKNRFKNEVKDIPYKFGSTESNCALKCNFDIDVCMECYPDSFDSIPAMYFAVENYLRSLVGSYSIVDVRAQTKSVGVFFLIRNEKLKVDVVPKKLTHINTKDRSGYLYLNRQGIFERPGRTKTNIPLLKSIKLTDPQNRILVILKTLKSSKGISISSHLLKVLIQYAYEAYRGEVPKQFTKKVIMVLQYIADNIENIVVKSIENTNNVLTDKLTGSEKSNIRSMCLEIIREHAYQPNSILRYFGELSS